MGHASYRDVNFPFEQSGVFKFRGFTSLTRHTSVCNFCSSCYSAEVAGVLVYQTTVLGDSGQTAPDGNMSQGYEQKHKY